MENKYRFIQVFQCKDENEGQYILVDGNNKYIRYFNPDETGTLKRFLIAMMNKDIWDTKSKEMRYYKNEVSNDSDYDNELNEVFETYKDDTILGIESVNGKDNLYIFNRRKWNDKSKEYFDVLYKHHNAIKCVTNE